MKYIFLLLLISTTYARDYIPYVKVESRDPGVYTSGVVVDKDDNVYKILTVRHILEFMEEKELVVSYFTDDRNICLKLPAKIIYEDEDNDLLLIFVKNPKNVSIKPVDLADKEKLSTAFSHGFAPLYRRNAMTIVDNTRYKTLNDKRILLCRGACLKGMSGSALIQDNKLIGIQSARANNGCLFSTIENIREIIEYGKKETHIF